MSSVTIKTEKRRKAFVGSNQVRVKKARASALASKRMGTTVAVVRPGRSLAGAQILPDRLDTVFESTGAFFVPISNMSATAGNYMNIMVNSIYQPFQGGYPVATSANAYSMHGTWVQGYAGSQNPIGYNGIANLYSLYKVKKVVVQVTVQPQNSADTLQAVLFPIGSEAIPTAAAGGVNLQVMLGQPRNKTQICANGTSAKFQTLTLRESIHDILGRRKQQWMDEAGTAIGSQPPAADQAFAGLFLQALDGGSNVSQICVTIRMWQYTELTDLIQQVN